MSVSVVVAALLGVAATTAVLLRCSPTMVPVRPIPVSGGPVIASRRRAWRDRFARRARPPDDLEVAAWCEHAARSLRGGHSLQRAMADAALIAPEAATSFAGVTHAVERGRLLADALAELDVDLSRPVGLVVPVLGACAELGGPAAAPLERTAATLQARAAERAERQANSAQARLSARVLTTMPVGMLALLSVAEPSVRATLATPAGLACIGAGALCNVGGWWWMRHIIERAA